MIPVFMICSVFTEILSGFVQPHVTCVLPNDLLDKGFMSSKSKPCKKNMCCHHVNNNNPLRSQFCTCHDSSAVVACAKLWADWIMKIKIKSQKVFSQILIYELINDLWNDPRPSPGPFNQSWSSVQGNGTEFQYPAQYTNEWSCSWCKHGPGFTVGLHESILMDVAWK